MNMCTKIIIDFYFTRPKELVFTEQDVRLFILDTCYDTKFYKLAVETNKSLERSTTIVRHINVNKMSKGVDTL